MYLRTLSPRTIPLRLDIPDHGNWNVRQKPGQGSPAIRSPLQIHAGRHPGCLRPAPHDRREYTISPHRTPSPNQKQPVIFHVYDGNTDCGVTVLNLTAMVAIESLTDTDRFDLQLPCAMRTEFKRHRAILRFKKKPGRLPGFWLMGYWDIGNHNYLIIHARERSPLSRAA